MSYTQVYETLKARVSVDPAYKAFREKTTNLTVLGLRLPVMHEVDQAGFSFYEKTSGEILKIWNQIWNSADVHEVMYMPLFYYRRHKAELDPSHWKIMKRWVNRVENWEHADALCYLYSLMFERHPKLIEPTLWKWNRSQNPWKRRASVVSTIYYASKNRKAPSAKLVLDLAKSLVEDSDPYVQKGVGWQLRECYKIYPEKTLSFIEKHLTQLPAITFSYATEKISAKKKVQLKAVRESARREQ